MEKYTRPDFPSIALITIDTQRDTLDGQPLEIPGTSDILPLMQKLLAGFRQYGRPIIHIVRIYKKDGSNVDLCRRRAVEQGAEMLIEGSPGGEPALELLPDKGITLDHQKLLAGGTQNLSENEVIIYKPRWGAFYNTPLDAHLKKLGVSTLIFTGCNFPNCPRTSIYEASERDYRIILVEDAVSGLYPQGREEMENIGVLVMNTTDVLQAMNFPF
ncbi:cysteine hydrolase family protein [Thermodesulfobacteriota bacterium]